MLGSPATTMADGGAMPAFTDVGEGVLLRRYEGSPPILPRNSPARFVALVAMAAGGQPRWSTGGSLLCGRGEAICFCGWCELKRGMRLGQSKTCRVIVA